MLISDCKVVFSKSYCPYCNATKSLLSELGAKYEAVELDQIGSPPPFPSCYYDKMK